MTKALRLLMLLPFLMASSSTPPKVSGNFNLVKTHEAFEGLKVFEFQHKSNGLKIFLVPKPGSNSIGYVTAYNVGSRFEQNGLTGLAHLFEHMMFRGTETYPEPFKTLSEWGGQYNAFTSRDMTVYFEMVPANYFDQVAHFESERMRKLLITKAGFDTERGAVVSERKKSVDDSPFGKLYWELYQTAYDKHTYKTGPIGWQKDLDKTKFEDALQFYNRFYAPNRATISIVGDFDISDALAILDKYYGEFKSQEVNIPKIPKENIHRKNRRKIVPFKTEQVIMADATFGQNSESENAAAELFLCVLLGEGSAGYLSYELVEKGIAQSVNSSCFPNIDTGLSIIFLTGIPGAPLSKLENAYDKAFNGFSKWLTDDRIESIKLYFTMSQLSSLKSPINLAKDLGTSSILSNGDPLFTFKLMEKVKTLKRKDIIKAFNAWKKVGKTRVFLQPRG